MPAIKATAAAVDPEQAQRFWAGLRNKQDGATAKRLADGVRKVWLDGKVTPTLDKSVPQIGAPTAWAAGYDGSGTESGVLAGMEWAAHSGAKVVSMSLGADTSTDGTDPMSQAVPPPAGRTAGGLHASPLDT
ncbi:hypothetical protein OG912_33440 [Streptomyces sp. NBC_00464]|uniref:S8 family serine peptidase n=1 Tax=Streptomyces sp. NBC_00464 TaxID=2975751 RepID=UPI002E17258C